MANKLPNITSWKPGESGNPGGRPKHKPFRDALVDEAHALSRGLFQEHPEGSLRWNAQRLLLGGTPAHIQMVADRLDGKVPQAIVGDKDHPSVTGYREWLEWMARPELRHVFEARTIEHEATESALITNGSKVD